MLLAPASAVDPPNIVFILADDLGYGDVACYNSDGQIATPNIDRLAAEGLRFTDAHAGGSICVPSRYALLTGQFAVRANLSVRDGPVISEQQTTIASLLRDQGFRTAMVGKWHLGFATRPRSDEEQFDFSKPLRGGPVDRGFQSFYGMHASLDIPPYFYIRNRQPVQPPTEQVAASPGEDITEGWNRIQGAFWRAGKISKDFDHARVTPRFADEAVEIIHSHAASAGDRPLFLYVALPSPHTPWLPTAEFAGQSTAGTYGDFVMQVDSVVGRITKALDTAEMGDDTLLVFSSDNGPVWYDKDQRRFGHSATAGLRGMKFSSWEGGHRVPFIVRWPARVAPQSVSAQTIVFSDVLATFAELVGAMLPSSGTQHDSVSFLLYLLDSSKPPTHRSPIVHDARTVRDGKWKLILPPAGGSAEGELYDLERDLFEQHNVIQEHPGVAQSLSAHLQAIGNAR